MGKRLLKHSPTAFVALAVLGLALADGGYAPTTRGIVAVAIWWAILLGLALAFLPLRRPTRQAQVTGVLLGALTLLAGLSILWAASDEQALIDANRVGLYLGVFVLAVLAGTRGNVTRWSDGLAIGIAAVAILALASRAFPEVFPHEMVRTNRFGFVRATRLNFPIHYWNALGVLMALGFPPLLRIAACARTRVTRGLGVAALPVLGAVIFLTGSRGAVAALLVGLAVFVTLARPLRRPLWALACAGIGSAGLIVFIRGQALIAGGLLDAPGAPAQGLAIAAVTVLVCVLTGLAYAAVQDLAPPLPRLGRAARVALVVAAIIAVVGVVSAADPVSRFERFTAIPYGSAQLAGDSSRFLASEGSGRWQLWVAAVDQFRAHPVLGQGAGSYESWWGVHSSFPFFVRNAHSLYLETLGELGIVGFLLLVAAFVYGAVTGVRRTLRAQGSQRVTLATLSAGFLAYAAATGIDWMWEVPLVTAVGIVWLGLLTGPATAPSSASEQRPRAWLTARLRHPDRSLVAGAAVAALALLLIVAQGITLLTQIRIEDSQAAAARGDLAASAIAADGARRVQPWAATPYLQLALIDQARSNLPAARAEIYKAIARDPLDWRLWRVRWRILRSAGETQLAQQSALRARDLNPSRLAGPGRS